METNKKLIFAFRNDKLGVSEVVFCWQPGCKWLAFCGETRIIVIVDRLGKKLLEFQLKNGSRVKQMEFDCEGDTLAVIQDQCSIATVNNLYTKKTIDIEIDKSNKDKPTCIRWAKNHPTLSIGTEKGLIYYYNKKSDKIYPVSLNHTKAVISADWNDEGNLVTGDENKSLSVTNRVGEPLLQNAVLKADPKMVKWARQKTSESKNSFTTISTVLNNKTILIYDVKKKSNPIELALDSDYGDIVTYQWFGDGYIAIGFSKGFISVISTHMNEIKNEVHSMQPFKFGLDDLHACEENNRLAVAGENTIKIYNTNTWTEIVEEKIEISNMEGRIKKIMWSSNGQIMLASTILGSMFAFNVVINDSYTIYKNIFANLISLNEICAYEIRGNIPSKLFQLQLLEEPKTFTTSQNHFVANYSTKVQIFKIEDVKDKPSSQVKHTIKDFSSLITTLTLNKDYLAVLADGRLHFMHIDTNSVEKIFPLKDTDDQIFCAALTDNFLIYSDSNHKLKIYAIKDNYANICDYKFENPIKKIFPNNTGTKYICVDNIGKGYLFDPIKESCISLLNQNEITSILWDTGDQNTFISLLKNNSIQVFVFIENSLDGAKVIQLKEYSYLEDLDNPKIGYYNQVFEANTIPIYLSNGYLHYYVKATKEIKGMYLMSHYWIYNWRANGDTEDGHKKYFIQNFQLGRYWECIKATNYLNSKKVEYLEKLGKEALKNLNIDVAEEAFRRAGNNSLILIVEKLRNEHEKKVLLGHIASILGEESLAQEFFKNSSKPKLAVELRMDSQDWDMALNLAREYDVEKEPIISKKIAYQFETVDNHTEAMKMYEKSVISDVTDYLGRTDDDHLTKEDIINHNMFCNSGISKCCFRLGDTSRGMNIAQELTDKNLIIEIAALCESLMYNLEAAKLYSQVGLFEKAATIYISLKHFKLAEVLIDKIKSPKLLIQMAKMKEAEKLYKDAEFAYESAADWENVIRINTKYLNNPVKAKEILFSKCKTETAALMLSSYYESMGKKKETIEFYLIAKKLDEAFAIAQSYNEMDVYADYMLVNNKNSDEFKKIAIYYEGKNLFGKSGIFYEKMGNSQKALRMYIKGLSDEYLEKAVEMVGNARDDSLINELIDYLLGNNIENSHHYLTRLYILLGNYKQACEIAISLASQVNYKYNY
jgi:WD repeat-containing protein 19